MEQTIVVCMLLAFSAAAIFLQLTFDMALMKF